MPERTRRRGRRSRRARKQRNEIESQEPVTKWFESDALPEDGGDRLRQIPSVPDQRSEDTGTVPPVRSRPGRHRTSGRPLRPKRRPSPRREAQRRRRRESRARLARRAEPVAAVAALIAAVVVWQLSADRDRAPQRTGLTTLATTEATTTLLVGSETATGPATWLTLLSFDPTEQKGAVVYIPAHTAVEVPGRGLQPLGEALASGDTSLLMVSAESLLGLDIDHFEQVTLSGASAFFEQIGDLTIDVPHEVRLWAGDDNARLLFTEGPQELEPARLVELLYTVGLDGDDVELAARHLAFWDSLLDEFHTNPSVLGASVVAVGDAVGPSDASAGVNAELFESLAELRGEDLTLTVLPVRQVSVGRSELYEADAEEVAQFVDATLSSVDSGVAPIEVQVLNGNGAPGVGQDVAENLVGRGFRVALSGNARNFTHKTTEIITYDASEAGIAAAERVKDLLGVGRVLVSAQEQGIVSVDLTIVVGKDFLRTR